MSTSRFVAGALIGFAAGLLLAPKRGAELRNDLAENADKLKRRLDRLAGKVGPELNDLRNILEDEVNGLSDDVRYRILSILDETEEGARAIKHNIASELR
ncbi:MAG: YtxH domain-containing protein [Bacteroidota bacterium]